MAQNGSDMTLKQKKAAANTIYTFLRQYLKASKLKKQGTVGFSDEKKQAFLSLFEPEAMVWDDLTPSDFPNKTLNNTEKTVENMVADYEKYFPNGFVIKNINYNINFNNLAANSAQIVIQRNISGKYLDQYFISNRDVILELNLELSSDFLSAKISGIRKIVSNPIACSECPAPLVELALNNTKPEKNKSEKNKPEKIKPEKTKPEETKPEKVKPEKTKPEKTKPEDTKPEEIKPEKTKPEKIKSEKTKPEETKPEKIKQERPVKIKTEKLPGEKPGLTFSFNFSGSGNAPTIAKPELSKMNYGDLIKSKNNLVGFSTKGGIAFSGGLDLNMMFGKTKKVGIGAGLFFSHSQAKLNYDTIHQEYRGHNQGDLPDFLRLYTAYNISENILMNNIGVNLLFKYNGGSEKTGLFIDCGPVYIFSSIASSNYESTSDYEAVYQHKTNGYYFDPTVEIDENDWVITRQAFLSSNHGNQTEAEYFNSLENFNVAIDKKDFSKSEKFKFKQAYGGLLKVGISTPVSEKIQFLAGMSFVYLTIQNNSNYNKELTEKLGSYNSTLYAINGITNINFGINLGLVIKLYKTEKK